MNPEPTLEVIKKRAIKGIAILTGRTFLLQAIAFVSIFLLSIFLSKEEFGIYYVVTAAVSFFAYFSDVGLAAALIQKKEGLTEEDLKTTFTIQQSLVLLLVLLIFAATPVFQSLYNLNQDAVYLLWVMAISLMLSSLKTIPSVILERQLSFDKLIIPQIAEALVFNIVVVYLAWQGYGISSFSYAILLRGIVGLLLIYLIQPWLPRISFSKSSLKSLLKFGLPYQFNSFLAVIKDDGLTAFLGILIGVGNVGLLGWAQKWASAPLRFFMDTVIKVTFPAYSRMQDDKQSLSRAVTRSILFINLLVFPALVGLITVAPNLVDIIPRYQKWEEALLALSLLTINSAWAALTTPLTNALNAIGKINITFKLMVMWTVLSWIFIPVMAFNFGVNGAAAGYALLGSTSIVAIFITKKYIDFELKNSTLKPLISALGMGVIILLLDRILPNNWASVGMMISLGIISYLALIYLLFGNTLIVDVKKFSRALAGRE